MTFAQNLKGHSTTVGVVPQSLASTASAASWGKWVTGGRSVAVIAYAGAIAGGGSVTIKLQQATDSGGTGAADVAGYTSLIAYDDTMDNTVRIAEIPASTLANIAASSKPYMSLIATTASATVLVSAAVVHLDVTQSGT